MRIEHFDQDVVDFLFFHFALFLYGSLYGRSEPRFFIHGPGGDNDLPK
jgi:hypothetical protein